MLRQRFVPVCALLLVAVIPAASAAEVPVKQYDLPASDVIQFTLSEGTKVIARPSGTEPKIKFYILVHQPGDDLVEAKETADDKIEVITTDLVRLAEAIAG